jgi:bloom syndrome protein
MPSTMVSSPARQSTAKKKGKAVANVHEESDEDFGTHSNGYARDGFVVGDDEDSDDDFEAMPHPLARRRKKASIGPPISRDARLMDEGLTDIHKDIIGTFFQEAKELEENVRANQGHRQPIFSQYQLREMGLRWTVTLDEMQRIPGINKNSVDRYGSKFLPLIRNYQKQYQEIMGVLPTAPRPMPRFPGEIVDLVTSDEDEDENEDVDEDMEAIEDDDDEDDGEGGETSAYFEPPAGEMAFLAEMGELQQAGRREKGEGSSKSRGRTSGSGAAPRGKSSWRGGKKQFASRRSSGGKSGVRKRGIATKKATGGQASGGSGSSSRAGTTTAARGKSSGRLQTFGFQGIGLMDH